VREGSFESRVETFDAYAAAWAEASLWSPSSRPANYCSTEMQQREDLTLSARREEIQDCTAIGALTDRDLARFTARGSTWSLLTASRTSPWSFATEPETVAPVSRYSNAFCEEIRRGSKTEAPMPVSDGEVIE
jgi:hypothetical protein